MEVKTVEDPKPGRNDVVAAVKVVGICGVDIHCYDWDDVARSLNLTLPYILGHEMSAEIIEIGKDVEGFEIGDRIAAETHIPCEKCSSCQRGNLHLCDNLRIFGLGSNGAFADYTVVPSVVAYKIPEELSDEQGAVLEPLGVAVHTVERSGLRVGNSVAVTGCGPIGLLVIAVARAAGATQIVATDVVDYRLDLARQMGATTTLNPGNTDVAEQVKQITGGMGVDNVFEASGNSQALETSLEILRKRGTLVVVGVHAKTPSLNLLENVIFKEASIVGTFGREIWGTWHRTAALLKSEKIDVKPILTHRFSLDEMDDAFQAAKSGESGKILLSP